MFSKWCAITIEVLFYIKLVDKQQYPVGCSASEIFAPQALVGVLRSSPSHTCIVGGGPTVLPGKYMAP
eukprot:m.37202 g.37202  ORF g.37202 m.37202 type:complete len:68 (+) comp9275_c0_seq2:268-471(+)